MKCNIVRQWEGGYIRFWIAQAISVLAAAGIYALYLAYLPYDSPFLLAALLIATCIFGAELGSLPYFRRADTRFAFSEDGVAMLQGRHEKMFDWSEVERVYLCKGCQNPSQNNIIFAKGEIQKPRRGRIWRTAACEDNCLFWMAYTEEKEAIIAQLAPSKIIRL